MRKSEREVVNFQKKMQILMRCGSMTLAFHEEGGPYLVPLNFGAEEENGSLVLYFHCALEGKKLELLKQNNEVGFCAYTMLRVFNKGVAPCGYTTDYESVSGKGKAEVVTEPEKRLHGLKVLMAHYTDETFSDEMFSAKALAITTVVKVTVDEWTGKRLIRKDIL